MVGSWGSGAIMGTIAPEIGRALLHTLAVLTSDAGRSVLRPKFSLFEGGGGLLFSKFELLTALGMWCAGRRYFPQTP